MKRLITVAISMVLLAGLIGCSDSDNEVAELRKELEQTKAELDELQNSPTPETSPVTLSVEEKEYYRQACEDSLGVPPDLLGRLPCRNRISI